MKIVFLVVFLMGCSDGQLRQYNHEDREDLDCYAHYGAEYGYCDAIWHKGVPK